MNDKFLKNLSQHACSLFLADSKIGLEKESLRVDKNGTISLKMHPEKFGSSLTNKYITTDYSEALIEIVSPPCSSRSVRPGGRQIPQRFRSASPRRRR